jgi:hypothetical protein
VDPTRDARPRHRVDRVGRAHQAGSSAARSSPPTMSETIALGDKDVAYLVGKAGETRMRLEKFSGAQLSIDSDVVKISGTDEAREVRAARNSSARNRSVAQFFSSQ